MTPDYERAEMAANLFAAECSYALVFERSGNRWKKAAGQSHEKAILHLTSAAAAMGFVLAPMMPEQPAPDDLRAAYDREVLE